MIRKYLIFIIILSCLFLLIISHGQHQENKILFSYRNLPEYFDKYFVGNEKPSCKDLNPTKGIIVNHHLLAGHLIAKTLNFIKCTEPTNIVLISPNHFNNGNDNIQVSDATWVTPYGRLESNKNLIKKIINSSNIKIDNDAFAEEHGISTIMPFIKKYSPNSKVIPLILKDNIRKEDIDKISSLLINNLPKDTIFIASIDFSHYLPQYISDYHDKTSLEIIKNFDFKNIDRAEIDSIPSLRLILKVTSQSGYKKFNFIGHTSSDELLKTPDSYENTSYIVGRFEKGENQRSKLFTMTVFGDAMFGRYIGYKIQNLGIQSLLDKSFQRFIQGSDITLINLEGIFKENPIIYDKDNENLIFEFEPKIIRQVKQLGFNLLNLANNHSLNSGSTNFKKSVEFLKSSSLEYFGHPNNSDNIYVVKEIRGTKICIIGYHEFGKFDEDYFLSQLKTCKSSTDLSILYTHWGIEYAKVASPHQVELAHFFIDNDIDIIFGSHPHVIQNIEIYKGKPIFYSLGNFIFDGSPDSQTVEALSIGLSYDADKKLAEFSLFPLELKNPKTYILTGIKRNNVLRKISENSTLDSQYKSDVQKGVLTINL